MSPKKTTTGLAAFSQSVRPPAAPVSEVVDVAAPRSAGRTRAKGDRVAIPFRMSRRNWERVHQLALSDGVSIQRLLSLSLSREFESRGLPPLED